MIQVDVWKHRSIICNMYTSLPSPLETIRRGKDTPFPHRDQSASPTPYIITYHFRSLPLSNLIDIQFIFQLHLNKLTMPTFQSARMAIRALLVSSLLVAGHVLLTVSASGRESPLPHTSLPTVYHIVLSPSTICPSPSTPLTRIYLVLRLQTIFRFTHHDLFNPTNPSLSSYFPPHHPNPRLEQIHQITLGNNLPHTPLDHLHPPRNSRCERRG
jgi:hypothetical protein